MGGMMGNWYQDTGWHFLVAQAVLRASDGLRARSSGLRTPALVPSAMACRGKICISHPRFSDRGQDIHGADRREKGGRAREEEREGTDAGRRAGEGAVRKMLNPDKLRGVGRHKQGQGSARMRNAHETGRRRTAGADSNA